jgi:endonuclease/exonuclease/phosphatase family metal-dependent hydrolase
VTEPVSFRIVSYNVNSQRGDGAALVELVRGLDPDIVVVQEAPRRLRWRTLNAHLARRFGLVYAAGGAPSLGNVVLTSLRVQVHESWCVQFPLTPGRHMRGAVFARCAIGRPAGGAASFVVGGTHLATDPAERPTQAAIVRRVMDEVELPLVLAADVNEEPGGSAWRTLADGLTDSASAAADGAPVATFPAPAPDRRIDAVFVGEGLTVRAVAVADGALARRASDHLPLVVDLTVP